MTPVPLNSYVITPNGPGHIERIIPSPGRGISAQVWVRTLKSIEFEGAECGLADPKGYCAPYAWNELRRGHHVVIRQDVNPPRFECFHCHETQELPTLPIRSEIFSAIGKTFNKLHKKCQPTQPKEN